VSGAADVAIVGGGGMGSAIAYFLASLAPERRIVVYERDPTYAHACTALAAGGIRQMFSTPENVLMSQFGLAFIEAASETLAVDGERPDLGLKRQSYMRLLPASAREAVGEQVEMQRSLGARPAMLSRAELSERFSWLNVEDVDFAVLGGGGEGQFDPYGLLQALRRKAVSLGVEFRTASVAGLERSGERITAVRLADGSTQPCALVVDAAGPRAATVAAMAGLDLPVRPMKAHTFAFRPQTPVAGCPIVLDQVTGFNFKPEGPLFLAAWPREAEPRDEADFEPDEALFEAEVWPALAHRVPAFEAVKLARAWVGHIEWNAFDANPVLGPHPECPNFVFAAGFSGHGAQHIPAAGRGVAELLALGEYRSLDLSRFGYERLVENRPLRELV
jgi:glycine/D-amino acid oxidase-like deaminating enzyme